MTTTDEDLFRPTLDARHDVAGIGRPFNPQSLVFASFFAGPVGGGWLLSRNFRELGMPRAARACAGAFTALTLVIVAATVVVTHEPLPEEPGLDPSPAAARIQASGTSGEPLEGSMGGRARKDMQRRTFSSESGSEPIGGAFGGVRKSRPRPLRLVFQAVTVVAALIAARYQSGRFRVFTAHGGTPKPAFASGLLAFVVGVPLQIALVWCGLEIASRI